uniref:MAGE domain-containing protein n=1 Tax=Loxodonta africana TaxID=9785 RepID=G3UB86_LOXAF
MPQDQKSEHCEPEQGLQAQRETHGQEGAQVPGGEEEEAMKALSLITEEGSAAGARSAPQSPQGACPSLTAISPAPSTLSAEGPSSQIEEGASSQVEEGTSSQVEDTEPWRRNRLVKFLLLKNRRKEPTMKAEILALVIRNYNSHFPVIFRRALEVMQLIFGIDMKPAGPTGHSYVLVPTLGLAYDGMPPGGVPSAPKSSLLILVLGVMFLEGNCAREEKIWETLGMIGVYAEQEHFIYSEPRRLLTQDWVQEKYLVYQRGSSSLPGCSELLWGLRAHAETSKMKVLGFLAKASGTDPSSFPSHYAEALREEEERGRAPVAARARTRAVGCIHSRATSSTFSCPL